MFWFYPQQIFGETSMIVDRSFFYDLCDALGDVFEINRDICLVWIACLAEVSMALQKNIQELVCLSLAANEQIYKNIYGFFR